MTFQKLCTYVDQRGLRLVVGNDKCKDASPCSRCCHWSIWSIGGSRGNHSPHFPHSKQDCEDESEGDGRKRERSLLLLASLASDALDAVSGMIKVQRCVIVLSWSVVVRVRRVETILRPVTACLLGYLIVLNVPPK